MKTINLNTIRNAKNKLFNLVAFVDDEDYERVNKYKWSADKAKRGFTIYAMAQIPGRGRVRMHRFIMNFPEDQSIDHKDNNGLNNQKSNLRYATRSQNMGNKSKSLGTTSQYKGVTKTAHNKWMSRIHNEKSFYLGTYGSEIEAAKVYDYKAKELFGEFAKLNFAS